MTAGQTKSITVQRGPARNRPGVRCRAAKACIRCNEKRVKCDAVERGIPCTRCEQRREPDCTLIQSRRGIYVRKPRRQARDDGGSQQQQEQAKTNDSAQSESSLETRSSTRSVSAEPGQQHQQHDVSASQNGKTANSPVNGLIASESQHPASLHNPSQDPMATATITATTTATTATADIRFQPNAPHPDNDTPSDKTEASNTSSYREISWATMFDHLLEGQQKGEGMVDKYSITYLGETFPLALILKDLVGGSGQPKLHHPGPPCPDNEGNSETHSMHHPPYMRPEDIAFLDAKKAFETPDRDTLDALIGVFLSRVFPIYPIVHRQEFLQQYNARRVPWILLHALCFVAATYCPVYVLHRARFENRREARWSFYSKAKALFDAGYEGNKIVVLQVSILMSFWGGGPNNYGNFYSYISTGVTIAETIGCHRSMAGANINPHDRSLLKLLWWILVVRDTHCAVLVGRPFRVNLDHCDAEPLTPEDFQYDAAVSDHDTNPYVYCSGTYQIQVTKLSLILRRIIMGRFYPQDRRPFSPSALRQLLAEWRAQVPPQLDWSDKSSYTNVFASCLSILYNHHLILVSFNCPPEPVPANTSSGYQDASCSEDISTASAQSIAATACGVATKSDVLLVPHEFFHGIFLASAVFYTQTKSTQQVISQLGKAGLTNCQMALHESRDNWDPSPWILQLFDKLLGTTASNERGDREGVEDDHTFMQTFMNSASGTFGGDGLFPSGFGMWQSHPVLGNLFEVQQEGHFMPMTPSVGDRMGPAPSWF